MMTKIKEYACFTEKIHKNTPLQFKQGGASARRTGNGSAFGFWNLEWKFLEKFFKFISLSSPLKQI